MLYLPFALMLLIIFGPQAAYAGAGGPTLGSASGIVVLVVIAVIGFFLGRYFKK